MPGGGPSKILFHAGLRCRKKRPPLAWPAEVTGTAWYWPGWSSGWARWRRLKGGSSDEPGSMSLSALPGCGRGVSSSTTRQCCTVDPCPCSSGRRRTDQDQGRVSKRPGAGESETASQQLLEPFAERRAQERYCDLEQAGIPTPLVVDAHEEHTLAGQAHVRQPPNARNGGGEGAVGLPFLVRICFSIRPERASTRLTDRLTPSRSPVRMASGLS
jgi:hypothetical protein